MEIPHLVTGRFPSILKVIWPRAKKSSARALEKLWAYLCWLVELIRGSQALFLNPFVVTSIPQSKDLEKLHLLTVSDIGLQRRPGLAFWSSFHFLGPYFSPLSLCQEPRLVVLILKFHRKVPRSFFGPFPAFWHCFAAGPPSPGPTFCEAFELIWSSWAQFWIIPFTFPLLQLKKLRNLTSRFRYF